MDRDLSLKTKSVQSFASDSGGRWSFSFFTTFSCMYGVMYVCTVRSNYCTISVGQVDYFPVVVRRGEDRR